MAQDTLTLARCREMALENNKQMAIAEQTREKALRPGQSIPRQLPAQDIGHRLTYYTGMDNDLQIPWATCNCSTPPAWTEAFPGHATHLRTALPVLNYLHGQHTAHRPPCGLEQHLFGGRESRAARVYGRENRIGLQMAKTGRELAELNRHLTEAEVIVQTDEAYWLYVRASKCEVRRVPPRSGGRAQRVVDNAHEAGMKSQNDVMKVQVKLNEADLQVLRADNGVRLARMNLCHVIGLPPAERSAAPRNLRRAPAPPGSRKPT